MIGTVKGRVACVSASLVVAALLIGSSTTAIAVGAGPCPNEAVRSEQGIAGLALPDCRAYEMASPLGSSPLYRGGVFGGAETGETESAIASENGNRVSFFSTFSPAGSTSPGDYFLSGRGQAGWSTGNLVPTQSTETGDVCLPTIAGYATDLSKALLADGQGQNSSFNCGADEPLLDPNEPLGLQNLFLRDNETGSYKLVNVTPSGVTPNNAWFQAGSDDLSHIVFSEQAQLTPEAVPVSEGERAAGVFDYYEYFDGTVHLLTVLPDGSPARGALVDNVSFGSVHGLSTSSATYEHTVSADGERVFWETINPNRGQRDTTIALYLRLNAAQPQSAVAGEECTEPSKACTVQVDASEAGGPGGGATFRWASADGSKVFFTDDASAKLTADTEVGSGANLYEYDLEAPEGERLTDLTPSSGPGALGVSGLSDDGSYVYFVAEGDLTGAQENSNEASAEAGQPNLYLFHNGTTTFITTLDPSDNRDWESEKATARVSPNGTFIALNSVRDLSGYSAAPQPEIFLYSAAQNTLSCASCDPGGTGPLAPAYIYGPMEPSTLNGGYPARLQRNVTDNGRVFFHTAGALLPKDTNGTYDVYEYQDGAVHLLSSGLSSDASFFFEASPSGDDAFFLTAQQLVGKDTDSGVSLYDARVDGGFPEPPPPPPCEGEACHGPASAATTVSTPGTSLFSGPGNQAEKRLACRKGFKKATVHAKTVCKKARKPHRHSAHHPNRSRLDRGGNR